METVYASTRSSHSLGLDTLQGREREPELFPILLSIPHRKKNLAFSKETRKYRISTLGVKIVPITLIKFHFYPYLLGHKGVKKQFQKCSLDMVLNKCSSLRSYEKVFVVMSFAFNVFGNRY